MITSTTDAVGVKIMIGKPTETADPSSQELPDSRPTAREPAWDQPSSGVRISPSCTSWLFGTHSLWWDAWLSLDAGARSSLLPEIDMPGFIDSLREALLYLGQGLKRGVVERKGREEKGETGWYVK